jgi:G3E family GTPase
VSAVKPVSIITGYLGSGKTTLLNALLAQDDMADTAVVINEFGEVAIDHLLVETSLENAVVLQSGCICCTVRGDLVDTLTDLEDKRARGLIPPYSRVLVETTGLADPAPIIQTLETEAVLAPIAKLGTVVATIDAVNGLDQLAQFPEPVSQMAHADVVIVTKTDMADRATTDAVMAAVRRINPTVEIRVVSYGRVKAAELFRDKTELVSLLAAQDAGHHHDDHAHDHGHDHDQAHAHEHHVSDPNRHDHGIVATSLVRETPLPWDGVAKWLRSLISLKGGDVLRLKGVLDIAGIDKPVVIQGVHHLIHPPTTLAAWPPGPRGSKIVVIARHIDGQQLAASLDRFTTSA